MKKIFLIIGFCILISACDYKPLYKNSKINNFYYEVVETKGDRDVNKYIIKNLERKSSNNKSTKYKIKLDTQYTKTILAKDSFGSPTDFELRATSIFNISSLIDNYTFNLEEKFSYKNLNENYEQTNYESSIKKNLASQITEKLIIKIATLK